MGIRLRSPFTLDSQVDQQDNPYVRIEEFGGGNGVDDSAAFVAALGDGRTIALDTNTTYRLKNIVIPVGCECRSIVGIGGAVHIVPPSSYAKNDFFFLVNKDHDFSFEGLFFDMPLNLDPFTDYRFGRAIWLAPTGQRGNNYRVENCIFSGALNAITGVGYIIENSRFAGNYVTATLGDSFSFNACINVDIVDNVFDNASIAAPSAPQAPSGVVRTGTPNQLDTTLNLEISRNVFQGCAVLSSGSTVDCYSGAARNIRVTDNIMNYNGNGIEMKTEAWAKPVPMPPGSSDVYEDNVVANNTIRLFTDRNNTGISVHHASGPQAAKGKAANFKIAGNIISCTADVAAGAFAHYAILVTGHDNVLIDSNQIFNAGHGISIGGTGPVGDVSDNVTISNNFVDVVDIAVQQSGGTINHLYIRNNPLLRTSSANGGSAVFIGSCTDVEVAGNRIENLAAGRQAFDMRGVTDARVTDNTIIAQGVGVTMSTTTSDRVKYRDNDVISGTGPAFDLAIGTNIEVQGNNIDVPISARSVSGAATFTAAGNIRGLRSTSPTGAAGGALGDIFLDSTGASRGWRCTVAATSTATYVAA